MECSWHKGCNKLGIYEFDGKKYCPKHYSLVLLKANEERVEQLQKPIGRASMGAGTAVINDGAGI